MAIDWNKIKSNAKAKDAAQYETMKSDKEKVIAAGGSFSTTTPTADMSGGTVGNALKGAAKGSAAGWVNTGGTLLDLMRNASMRASDENRKAHQETKNAAHYREMLQRGTMDDGTVIDAAMRERLEMLADRAERSAEIYRDANEAIHRPGAEAVQKAYQKADTLSAESAQHIEAAKKNTGEAGDFLVDVGVAGTQLVGDALTGGLVATGIRSFGSGAQEARQSGATLGQQVGYGAGNAALGVLTEKIANVAGPFKKAFGSGILDKALTKVAAKPAGKLAISALSEGLEEGAEALAQPLLQKLTYNPDAAYDADWLADTLYSMAVGGVLGGAGGAVDVATGGRGNNAATGAGLNAQSHGGEGKITPAQKEGAQGVSEANAAPVQVGRATTIQHPYTGATPTQTKKSGKTPVVSAASLESAKVNIQNARTASVMTNGSGFKTLLMKAYEKTFQRATGVPVANMTYDGKPYTVNIGSKVPGKVISDPNLSAEKLALLDMLPEIVQNGEYVGSGVYEQHSGKSRPGIRYDYFETPVEIGGQQYVAKFDVEVLPGANNYRTHQVVNMDLTQTEASLVGKTPTASSNESSPLSDPTITESAKTVNVENLDPLLQIMMGGKRVDQSKASNAQFDALAERGDIGVDAAGKLFQIDPAQHIDQRTTESVGSRKVNAFQFDHPQLHSFFRLAAQALIADADISLQFGLTRSYERGMQGNKVNQKAQASAHLRKAMDETGLSRNEIIDAAQRIVNDKGQENVKAAKQVEIILDDMLTHGWRPMAGEAVAPNEAYIKAKGEITGGQPGVAHAEELPIMENDGIGAANLGFDPYSNLQNQKDQFHPEGANAARPVDVPTTNLEGRNIPRSASNIMGAQGIDEHDVRFLEQQIADGKLAFDTITDEDSVSRAQATVSDKGFDGALEQYRQAVKSGVATKDNTTLGQQLLLQAMREGNTAHTAELLSLYTRNSTNAAQALQAQSIFRKLSPEGQLVALQKAVDALNEKYGVSHEISQGDVADFLAAETTEARQEVEKRIVKQAAQVVPGTFKAKFDTLRYLAMLGNPRTHIRNILGNTLFQVPVAVKNRVGAVAEGIAHAASHGKTERTKALFGVNPLGKLAKEASADWVNVKDFLTQSNKYMDGQTSLRDIEQEAHAFSDENALGRSINRAADFNSNALAAEDTVAKRLIYTQSLAGYLKANGCKSIADASPALLNKARTYAANEALRNTFNDTNTVSEAVSKLGAAHRSENKAVRAAGYVVEGVLPFKKTPANILVRAAEYSPVGAAVGIFDTIRGARSGNPEAVTQGLDRIAAGLTGTGLMALGALAAGNGWVTGGEDDDEKQAAFDDLTGHQAYALELKDGTSITLDWLAPEAIPFFMGVELFKAAESGGLSAGELGDTLKNATAPMLELSMLQGLNDTVDNAAYATFNGGSVLGSIITSALTNYATQVFPTLGGQLERTGEDVRMATYTDKNGELSTDMQYTLGKVSQKIPGWDYQQIPYIDAWGREEQTGSEAWRAFSNLVNPAYVSQVDVDKVEGELQRLVDATGEAGVFPERAGRYITTDDGRKDFTAEEYVKYAKDLGRTSYDLVKAGMDSAAYKGMSDAQRVEYLDDLYSYAGAAARANAGGKALEGWQANAKSAQKDLGISTAEYIALYQKYGSNYLSGNGYANTKAAASLGLSVDEYISMKTSANADGKNGVNKAEAMAVLDGHPKRVDLWDLINTTNANNPYA